jgi:heptosyltransferase III
VHCQEAFLTEMVMKIDCRRTKYFKRVWPYLHRAIVPFVFVVDYVRLLMKIRRINRDAPGRKIVVINLIEHFGDIVACEPVSRYIRRIRPDAFIFWSVRRPYQELIAYNSNVDQVLPVMCLSEWMLLKKSGLFDEIVDLQLQKRECPLCRRPLLKDAGNVEITVENYYDYGNLLAVFCQSAGIPVIEDQPQLYIPDETVHRVDLLGLPERFIVFHCTSNEESRDWEQDKWRNLRKNIIGDFHLPIVEIGLQPLHEFPSDCYINLTGLLSLLETAEVIKRAVLFIGIDSGPAHLANAVGTFGIILLGEYRNYRQYMPYSGSYKAGENARIIHADGPAASISEENVYEVVKKCKLLFRHS